MRKRRSDFGGHHRHGAPKVKSTETHALGPGSYSTRTHHGVTHVFHTPAGSTKPVRVGSTRLSEKGSLEDALKARTKSVAKIVKRHQAKLDLATGTGNEIDMAGLNNFGGKKAAPFKKGGGREKMPSSGKKTAANLRAQAKKMVKDTYVGSKKDADTRKLPPKQSKKEQKRESMNFSNEIALSYVGFDALKGKLAARGATNPGALAAWIGRRKYGKKGLAKLSGAGHSSGAKHSFAAKKARAAHIKK